MNDSGNQGEDRKIFVDSDWKEQVAKEKETLKQQESEEPQADPLGHDGIPEASFTLLLVALATQAMAALGQIPDPISNQLQVHLDAAKHHIDMLGVLEEKTRGNLTDEEAGYMQTTLAQLRMAFLAANGGDGPDPA